MSADPIRPDWEVVPLRAATGYCPDPMSSMRAHRRGGEPVPVLHLDTSINRQQRVDSGKSHLLAHLEHLAVSRDFVCSKVAISKETPLYDLGKVFTSAMENGRIPNRRGRFIEELVEQGMWMLGWEDGAQPQRAAEMQSGDRIAIKRMKGQGQTGIRILHLGIIKGVILALNRLSALSTGSRPISTETYRRVEAASSQFTVRSNTIPGFRKSSICERSANPTLQPPINPLRDLFSAELGRYAWRMS